MMNRDQIDTYQTFARSRLGYEFRDVYLLVTAFTHRSYVNEHKKSHAEHNERLEFLGDAILEVVTSDFLYRNFKESEGIMTSWRSALVRTESICLAGEDLGYEPLIRLSRGERAGSNRAHAVIIADCFEALIGAIYIDQGFNTSRDFIYKHILSKMDEVLEASSWRDPKSHFQELAQHFDGTTPHYRVIKEVGPDHNKTFHIGAYVNGEVRGEGIGHSKQDAQVLAAKEGIAYYMQLPGSQDV